MTDAPFVTLAADADHAEVIGGSDFLAFGRRADAPEAALAFLAEVRARHPDATHHCWAYRIGTLYRFQDDGEPGGTAGAPILRAIEGQGVDHVMVVVVRYFGGTKLGAGGLVRAYGGAAASLLRLAARQEVRPRVRVTLHAPFADLDKVHRLLVGFDLARGEERYDADGLALDLDLLAEDAKRFAVALRDATRGAARIDGV